jgi:CO/xanthine dehydrogenase Mo-binding subunit
LNLLFVLRHFLKERVDAFREPLRVARVAGQASVMFVLETELPQAAEAFAVKFDDIGRRRRILYGEDVIAPLATSPEAKKLRLRQVLLNLALRLRERYAVTSLREEQLAFVIADAAGPLRAAAATLLELEGRPVGSPKEALEQVARSLEGTGWTSVLELMSQSRETRSLPAGTAAPALFQLMALAEAIRLRLERLG